MSRGDVTSSEVKRCGAERTAVLTDQSREQLQVLLPDVQVETTVVQVHFRAATQGQRSGGRGYNFTEKPQQEKR